MSAADELIRLSTRYPTRYGTPTVDTVHRRIFTQRWFGDCGGCSFCYDWCCQWGVDTEMPIQANLARHADALERSTGVPRENWFGPPQAHSAELWPGGHYNSSRADAGACVFLRPDHRGCGLHLFALENGLDVVETKPMYCTLFPLTIDDDTPNVLEPDGSVWDDSLICLGAGPTLYWAQRGALAHYFGAAFVVECDAIQRGLVRDPDVAAPSSPVAPDDPRLVRRDRSPGIAHRARTIRLPVIR